MTEVVTIADAAKEQSAYLNLDAHWESSLVVLSVEAVQVPDEPVFYTLHHLDGGYTNAASEKTRLIKLSSPFGTNMVKQMASDLGIQFDKNGRRIIQETLNDESNHDRQQ